MHNHLDPADMVWSQLAEYASPFQMCVKKHAMEKNSPLFQDMLPVKDKTLRANHLVGLIQVQTRKVTCYMTLLALS